MRSSGLFMHSLEGIAMTKIIVKNNGSLRVEGEIELFDQNGGRFDLGGRVTLSLCRCGHSSTKPLCDGTHRAACFRSEVVAYSLPPIQAS